MNLDLPASSSLRPDSRRNSRSGDRAASASALDWQALLLVVAGIALTSAGHYLTPPKFLLWHGIFQHLYYLPVVYAGVAFGWIGGLVAGVVSALLYLPHIVMAWSGIHHYAVEQYVEIVIFVAVGLVTGILSDRERKRRLELQETAAELHRVNLELQSTFEQVKRADRLSAVGQLAAGLVHEIRNPIASIDGAAEVMESADEPLALRAEATAIIRKECSRLNHLLSSLLDFARPRNPDWGAVNVNQLLANVTELLRHSVPKEVGIAVRGSSSLPDIDGDAEQLAQVLMNVTINAVQAMPQGGDVDLSAFERDGGVTIQVSDSGIGVPPENIEKIFDPFFTTKDSGTGLGLSVAHQIVRQHGGSIAVHSNAGGGTTFSVWLPAPGRER